MAAVVAVGRAVALLALAALYEPVAAVRSLGAGERALADAVRVGLVLPVAQIALLSAVLDAVHRSKPQTCRSWCSHRSCRCPRRRRRSRRNQRRRCRRCSCSDCRKRCPRSPFLLPRVALLRCLDHAVTARRIGHVGLAVRGARAGEPAVHAIVAAFAEGRVDLLVPAVRRRSAVGVAQVLAVRRIAVGRSQVAPLGALLLVVAAVRAEHATRRTSAVAAVVLTVVAGFGAVLHAVATARAERAVRVALAVATRVVDGAVVAGLARVDRAIAALQLAVDLAQAGRVAVVTAVVAGLA